MVSKTSSVPDQNYLIGSSQLDIATHFTATYPNCQVEYAISFTNTTAAFNSTSIKLNNSTVSALYSDPGMTGEMPNVKVTATSVLSQSYVSQNFKVRFLSGCEMKYLVSGPVVMSSAYNLTVWQPFSQSFTPPVTSEPVSKCGKPSFKLVDLSGNEVMPDVFSFDQTTSQPKLKGLITNTTMEAMFPIQVQISATYGNDTKLSNPFTLNLLNPCATATLNTNSLSDMATTVLRASPELQAI